MISVNGIGKLKESGRPVIGCFPLYPPVEILHSMGLIPVVLWGLRDPTLGTQDADRHIQNFACSVARHLTQFVMAEGKGLFDGLFFYNACDTLRNLPEILREGLSCRGAGIPPMFRVHVPMVPPDQTDASAFLRNEIEGLVQALEARFGVRFSQRRFERSVELYARMRGLCKRLEEEVSGGGMPFADFCETIMHMNFLSVEDQIELLESRLASCTPPPEADAPAGRVMVGGILPPPPLVCHLMDEAGLRVVGNDIASLYRSYARMPDDWEDAPDYYVRFYGNHFPCTTLLYSAGERLDVVIEMTLERRAGGYVFAGEKFCEYEYFELPCLQECLRDRGVPVLSLEFSAEDEAVEEVLRTRIEAFGELLHAPRGLGPAGGRGG